MSCSASFSSSPASTTTLVVPSPTSSSWTFDMSAEPPASTSEGRSTEWRKQKPIRLGAAVRRCANDQSGYFVDGSCPSRGGALLTDEDLCRRIVHVDGLEDGGAVVGHHDPLPPAHALQDLVLRRRRPRSACAWDGGCANMLSTADLDGKPTVYIGEAASAPCLWVPEWTSQGLRSPSLRRTRPARTMGRGMLSKGRTVGPGCALRRGTAGRLGRGGRHRKHALVGSSRRATRVIRQGTHHACGLSALFRGTGSQHAGLLHLQCMGAALQSRRQDERHCGGGPNRKPLTAMTTA